MQKFTFLPEGCFIPSHYHPSRYYRGDKCLRNRITLWINYKQSGSNFLSVLPFYSWIQVLIWLVRSRRNVIKTSEIVSAKQREEHPPLGTSSCLPVLGDGDQLPLNWSSIFWWGLFLFGALMFHILKKTQVFVFSLLKGKLKYTTAWHQAADIIHITWCHGCCQHWAIFIK